MTQQSALVSGGITYAYNEHGEQVTEIDARGVVMTCSIDALDRLTAMTYDDPAIPLSRGRLTRIAPSRRGGGQVYVP